MTSEVARLGLTSLRVLPSFAVSLEMLESDGVHLKSVSGDLFLAHLRQSLSDLLSIPAPAPARDFIPLVDFATLESSEEDDDDVRSVADDDDRLGAILKIVKSNSRRLTSLKPLREALVKLDERSSTFEAQVRICRQRDNLVFARIKEDSDSEVNRSREDRVVISGLPRISTGVSSHKDKKDHYLTVVSDLVLKALPDSEPRPAVTDVIVSINRSQATPTIEAKFDSVGGAAAFRKSAYLLAKAGNSEFVNLFFSNSVTQATRVRIEIMKAISKKLSTDSESAYVHGFSSRPVLHYNAIPDSNSQASGTGRSYSFVDTVTRFGDLVQDLDLMTAYKRAGSTFRGSMEQYFVLLREADEVPSITGSNHVPVGARSRGRGARGTPFRGAWRGGRGQKRFGGSPPGTPHKKKSST
jgi:hypothetical protein